MNNGDELCNMSKATHSVEEMIEAINDPSKRVQSMRVEYDIEKMTAERRLFDASQYTDELWFAYVNRSMLKSNATHFETSATIFDKNDESNTFELRFEADRNGEVFVYRYNGILRLVLSTYPDAYHKAKGLLYYWLNVGGYREVARETFRAILFQFTPKETIENAIDGVAVTVPPVVPDDEDEAQ